MNHSEIPTPVDRLPPSTSALRIGRDLNLRDGARQAMTLLPKALMNFGEADPLPLAGCFIRKLRSDESHWCELCGDQRVDAREVLELPEHEIALCDVCEGTIEGGV